VENGNLSPEDKRELVKCVMFLILVGGIVLVVWIVKGTFAEDEWVAIGAAAALVQAIGVVGGVIYAALELKTIREEATANRSNNLLDELSRLLLQMTRIPKLRKIHFVDVVFFGTRQGMQKRMDDSKQGSKRVWSSCL
jgi:hypothetical protein